MIRKIALVGSKEGPWVSLAGMPEPHIRVALQPGTKLRVEHLNGKLMPVLTVVRSGCHELFPGTQFARVLVEAGDYEQVLCDFISRRDNVQT